MKKLLLEKTSSDLFQTSFSTEVKDLCERVNPKVIM